MALLKGKSGESLRDTLGTKDLQQVVRRSAELVPEIIEAENGYRDHLELLAADIVTKAYPIIDYANIRIDAKIVLLGVFLTYWPAILSKVFLISCDTL